LSDWSPPDFFKQLVAAHDYYPIIKSRDLEWNVFVLRIEERSRLEWILIDCQGMTYLVIALLHNSGNATQVLDS